MWPLTFAVLLVASRQVRCQAPVEPEEEFYLGTVVSEIIPITEPGNNGTAGLHKVQPDCLETTSRDSNTWELSRFLAATSSSVFYILILVAVLYLITVVGCIKCVLKADERMITSRKRTSVYHGLPTQAKQSRLPA